MQHLWNMTYSEQRKWLRLTLSQFCSSSALKQSTMPLHRSPLCRHMPLPQVKPGHGLLGKFLLCVGFCIHCIYIATLVSPPSWPQGPKLFIPARYPSEGFEALLQYNGPPLSSTEIVRLSRWKCIYDLANRLTSTSAFAHRCSRTNVSKPSAFSNLRRYHAQNIVLKIKN